jgi:hypothetical protein
MISKRQLSKGTFGSEMNLCLNGSSQLLENAANATALRAHQLFAACASAIVKWRTDRDHSVCLDEAHGRRAGRREHALRSRPP